MTPLLALVIACRPAVESAAPADPASPAPTTPPVTTPPEAPIGSPSSAEDLDPADGSVSYALTAAPATWASGGVLVDGYAYDGQVPGPTLRARVGDTVTVTLTNTLPDPTTIHWHGVSVPWAMDGATWMDDPVAPGATFTYTFVAERAGTFWYHPHFDTERQVDLGLYGMFVVEDPTDPPVAALELVLDTVASADAPAGGHGGAASGWTVNSAAQGGRAKVTTGPARVRLVNTSNDGYAALVGPLRVIGADQGLAAAIVEEPLLVLAPGDRAELELLATTTLTLTPYSVDGGAAWGEPTPLITVEVPSSEPAAWAVSGAAPSLDPGVTDVTYTLQGSGDVWLINGEIWPDVTIERLPLGASAVIEVRNLSAANHPFHLHGHAFEVLSVDGVAPTSRRIEDTLDVAIRQTVRLLLVADNPGEWMAHCHILPHAHDGMMTVLAIEEG
jgi:FtsP/CotA-like multicopper oxidase with cupredoxin domain